MWSDQISHMLLVGMKNGVVNLENSLAVSYKVNIHLHMTKQSHSWIFALEKQKLSTHKPVHETFTATLFATAKHWNQPNVLQWVNG